ncbi:hypothetical protein [Nonomuraea ceibae]|uniref:hypothetical protein n=1 Tax=Nonomuraea ceibae TaxID=1935170 RepID=UPI001C601960|nr:hypothetical protein [Nonomuraea ceibae]
MITYLLADLLAAVLPVLAWTLGVALILFAAVVAMFRPFVRADRAGVAAFAAARAATAAAAAQGLSLRGDCILVRLGGRLIRMEVV